MVMSRWDPAGEALSLRDAMNRLFEQAVLHPGGESNQRAGATLTPAIDVSESQGGYTISANLPGVKPEDVSIQFQQGVLTISGEVREEQSRQQATYHVRERRQGRFSRSLSLPEAVDVDRAQATFENGVLHLHLPRAEAAKPRRIPVQATGSA